MAPTWLLGWSLDPGTIVLLAVVLWLDGWRRPPDGAILLVRLGPGPWRVRTPWAEVGSFALVAWWSPVVLPLLLTAPATLPREVPRWTTDFDVAVARGRRRLRRIAGGLTTLRILGALLLMWIAFGIPLITSRFGLSGLTRGILSAVLFALALVVLAVMELRALGVRWWPSIRRAAHLVSPFSAPQAAELVATAAVEDVGPAVRAAVLLGDTRFLTWIRPSAYDVLHDRTDAPGGETSAPAILVRMLPPPVLQRAMAVRPDARDPDAGFCPRCARSYREGVTTCSDCGDLPLASPAVSPGP